MLEFPKKLKLECIAQYAICKALFVCVTFHLLQNLAKSWVCMQWCVIMHGFLCICYLYVFFDSNNNWSSGTRVSAGSSTDAAGFHSSVVSRVSWLMCCDRVQKNLFFVKSPTRWVLLGFGLYWLFGFFCLNEQLVSSLVDLAHQLSFYLDSPVL